MSYNFINDATSIEVVNECFYDTSVGYETDFSENGDVDGWSSFSLIHTYGSWGGFLFGTLYSPNAYIGRGSTFVPVPAETHYTLKISMKLNPQSGNSPSTGRVMWRTISNPSWDSTKSYDFTIYPDNIWHTYTLNMGLAQWWQGDVNNLRVYPMLDGDDGDEFFIRSIRIESVSTFGCTNQTCSYYSSYSHPCQGIGSRAYCQAQPTTSNYFTVASGINDELIVNINGYGSEIITLNPGVDISGDTLAKDLIKKISNVDIGGYAEATVTYSETGRFKIYSGTYTDDSTVLVEGGSVAETLGFFSAGTDVSTKVVGADPATGFKPKSSFKIKSFQLLELFDGSEQSYIEFDPFTYSVEGGRRDFVENGLGTSVRFSQPDEGELILVYDMVENGGKTIIDFNHPFNASGKIKKVYLVGSVVDEDGTVRTGCKIKVLRRNKEGQLSVVHTISIPNRSSGKLYSTTQEYVVVDCDLLVNKGDFLGVYNVDLYAGKSYTEEPDALYFQISGEASGSFDPGQLLGDGNAGFLFYARGEELQKKLFIDVDLGKRVNIKEINISGSSDTQVLEYNIARCLDINWQVDLFGGVHRTGFYKVPGFPDSGWNYFTHTNIAYGIDNLTDGIYGNENALAADSFTATDAAGVVPTNPYYFYVNGDEEWVGLKFHIPSTYTTSPVSLDFEEDPVALTLLFPSNKPKRIFKSVTYFKERHNFRSFALSYYLGPDDLFGNADNPHFQYIPEYEAVTLDSVRYHEGMEGYDGVSAYLFSNPCEAKPEFLNGSVVNYDEFIASEVVDWNILKHEFEPIECKGFRIYTDYHKSTKINEMELYSYIENEGTNVADSLSVKHSQYDDVWVDAELEVGANDSANAFIGGTPQYFRIEIEPISTLHLSDLVFTVNTQDVYVGEKGCEYEVLLDNTKINATNTANRVEFKNVYGGTYNLHVDIPSDAEYSRGLTFFSKMEDEDSISKPEVGPGASFTKKEDYPLVLRDNNCAINCPVYGLKNLVAGKQAYYSYGEGYSWRGCYGWESYGTVSSGVSVNFSNIQAGLITILRVPVLYSDRWWKIGFSDVSNTLTIREIKAMFNDVPHDCVFYHDVGLGFLDGPASDPAPHLNDGLLTGSTSTLANNAYITFDIGSMDCVDEIAIFHNTSAITSCTMSIYTSPDNTHYGHYADFYLEYKDFYIETENVFRQNYYTYFAIDLGQRHDLQIVRNYSGSNLLSCSLTSNVSYSSQDISNVEDVIFSTLSYGPEQTVVFYPTISADDGYINAATFVNSANFVYTGAYSSSTSYNSADAFVRFRSVNIPRGAFIKSAVIKLTAYGNTSGDTCHLRFYGENVNSATNVISPTDYYARTRTSAYVNWSNVPHWTDDVKYETPSVKTVVKEVIDRSGWQSGNNLQIFIQNNSSDFNKYRSFSAVDYASGAQKAELHVTFREYNITYGDYNDARWVCFRLLNGDGTTRVLRKLGIYPDITRYLAPAGGGYNHSWNSLGSSITTYSQGKNVALNVTVSGSSNFGELYLGKITDGIVGNTITDAWGSDATSTQWVGLYFDAVYDIYRVKIYHGYSTDDSDYLITDYTVQVSTDGSIYSTIFDISGNTEHEREHVLSSPVSASSIKINITGYSTGDPLYLPIGEGFTYEWFQGAVLREVEVNEYYGFNNISSEDYPIIAVDLTEEFRISGHSLVGLDPEDTSIDWDNSESSFSYSDSVLSDPKKVTFTNWGSGPHSYHDRWVAVKRNTATDLSAGPDYLKHVKVLTYEDPNPCEYAWWWSSNLSTLSNDYLYVKDTRRSLKIDYPTGSGVEHVYLIEGDTFGTDEDAGWRDALGFWFFIDDAANLDTDYGYVYFGDVNSADYVEYRWNFSTLASGIESGWTYLFLRFKTADDILYVENNDPDVDDPRIIGGLELKSFGMRFRSKGSAMTIYLDGFKIERNMFMDYSKFGQGLYMFGDDYVTAPLADFKLTQGTVEFWLRPDYDPVGVDYYNEFKYRTLFHFSNVANDVFGAMIGLGGFVVYVGNLLSDPILLTVDAPYWNIDDTFHLAFVYSNDGTGMGSDGSTLRLYFNGYLMGKITDTWEVSDSKHFEFFIGGKSLHAVKESFRTSSVDGVISYFKIHNYCKTDFSDSMADPEIAREKLWKPNELLEISKDNVTFLKVGDPNLPLIYENIPAGSTAYTYVRSSLPKTLTGDEARQASILASWFISI